MFIFYIFILKQLGTNVNIFHFKIYLNFLKINLLFYSIKCLTPTPCCIKIKFHTQIYTIFSSCFVNINKLKSKHNINFNSIYQILSLIENSFNFGIFRRIDFVTHIFIFYIINKAIQVHLVFFRQETTFSTFFFIIQ